MSIFSLLVLILVGVSLWYAIRKLKEIEVEIRRDIEAKSRSKESSPANPPSPRPEPIPPVSKEKGVEARVPVAEPPAKAPDPTREIVLSLLKKSPGVLQKDFYRQLPAVSSKRLQQLLLELDREGAIRREKSQGSYRIFPS